MWLHPHLGRDRATVPVMAQVTITRTLCDMPHDTDDVPDGFPVVITTPDGTWDVDLCAVHAAHFLMGPISAGRPQRRTRKRASVLQLVPDDALAPGATRVQVRGD